MFIDLYSAKIVSSIFNNMHTKYEKQYKIIGSSPRFSLLEMKVLNCFQGIVRRNCKNSGNTVIQNINFLPLMTGNFDFLIPPDIFLHSAMFCNNVNKTKYHEIINMNIKIVNNINKSITNFRKSNFIAFLDNIETRKS